MKPAANHRGRSSSTATGFFVEVSVFKKNTWNISGPVRPVPALSKARAKSDGYEIRRAEQKKTPLAAAQINMLFALGVITLTEVDDHEFMNLQ